MGGPAGRAPRRRQGRQQQHLRHPRPVRRGHRSVDDPRPGQEALTSIIVELVDRAAYADQTEFNGLILTDRYTLAPLEGGGTRITHLLVIGGPAAATVGPKPGPQISEDYLAAMDKLTAAASARQHR